MRPAVRVLYCFVILSLWIYGCDQCMCMTRTQNLNGTISKTNPKQIWFFLWDNMFQDWIWNFLRDRIHNFFGDRIFQRLFLDQHFSTLIPIFLIKRKSLETGKSWDQDATLWLGGNVIRALFGHLQNSICANQCTQLSGADILFREMHRSHHLACSSDQKWLKWWCEMVGWKWHLCTALWSSPNLNMHPAFLEIKSCKRTYK